MIKLTLHLLWNILRLLKLFISCIYIHLYSRFFKYELECVCMNIGNSTKVLSSLKLTMKTML